MITKELEKNSLWLFTIMPASKVTAILSSRFWTILSVTYAETDVALHSVRGLACLFIKTWNLEW